MKSIPIVWWFSVNMDVSENRIIGLVVIKCVALTSYLFFCQESERVVAKKEGIDFAREYGCLFIECSAKTRVNVEQCFEELVLKVCMTSTSFLPWLSIMLDYK